MTSSNELLNSIIEKRISNHEPIPDMVLDDFIELVAEACREICAPLEDASSALVEDTLNITDSVFGNLAQRLRDIYVYELHDEMTSETAFQIGACWGGVAAAGKCEEHQQDSALEKEELSFVGRHQNLFRAIMDEPGSSHGELAKTLGFSDPRLSQIMREAKPYQLISASMQGRSKHYYLTRKGSARYQTYLDALDSVAIQNVVNVLKNASANSNWPEASRRDPVLPKAQGNANSANETAWNRIGASNENYPMSLLLAS